MRTALRQKTSVVMAGARGAYTLNSSSHAGLRLRTSEVLHLSFLVTCTLHKAFTLPSIVVVVVVVGGGGLGECQKNEEHQRPSEEVRYQLQADRGRRAHGCGVGPHSPAAA
jgi:hypothetical protein